MNGAGSFSVVLSPVWNEFQLRQPGPVIRTFQEALVRLGPDEIDIGAEIVAILAGSLTEAFFLQTEGFWRQVRAEWRAELEAERALERTGPVGFPELFPVSHVLDGAQVRIARMHLVNVARFGPR